MKKIAIALLTLALTFPSGAAWAALTRTQVSQLYVAVFGRASEGDGNAYWQTDASSTSMTVTANIMLNTDPAKAYFGSNLYDNAAFVAHIYTNTLGKSYADDPEGQDYWVSELNDGTSKGQMIAALITAAQASENAGAAQDQFNNKVAVSDYCAITVAAYTDLTTFTGFIDDVTDSAASVTAAKALVDLAQDIVTVEGYWSGTWYSTYYNDSGSLTGSLSQSGSTIGGTLNVTNTDCGSVSNLPVSGSISNNVASFDVSATCDGYYATLEYTQGTVSGNTMSGYYTTYVDGSFYDQGTFYITR
ncbi:MAG: DUF4214 domain-containing protein [Desulfobulbaceae bacterium]|nr:DUF4214 domain-containing protein [Desulfobulbaceae bacterium]